jgi:hypothetical protein
MAVRVLPGSGSSDGNLSVYPVHNPVRTALGRRGPYTARPPHEDALRCGFVWGGGGGGGGGALLHDRAAQSGARRARRCAQGGAIGAPVRALAASHRLRVLRWCHALPPPLPLSTGYSSRPLTFLRAHQAH